MESMDARCESTKSDQGVILFSGKVITEEEIKEALSYLVYFSSSNHTARDIIKLIESKRKRSLL